MNSRSGRASDRSLRRGPDENGFPKGGISVGARRLAEQRSAAFSLVEMLVGVAVLGVFLTGLMTVWSSLTFTGLNTTAYASRQSDQMRVLDYLKRDIRRAAAIAIYDGATLITDTATFGTELRLTIPDYYSDDREEDHAIGTKIANAPTVSSDGSVAAAAAATQGSANETTTVTARSASPTTVNYGTALTVRYFDAGGAVIRNEEGSLRTIADSAGAFSITFKKETTGAYRCRVRYEQPMRGGTARALHREVDILCVPRFEFQL